MKATKQQTGMMVKRTVLTGEALRKESLEMAYQTIVNKREAK